jgi:hypothetical protein
MKLIFAFCPQRQISQDWRFHPSGLRLSGGYAAKHQQERKHLPRFAQTFGTQEQVGASSARSYFRLRRNLQLRISAIPVDAILVLV